MVVTEAGRVSQCGDLSFTVVICTRYRAACLDRCLESLRKLDYSNFDVLVIDNVESGDPQTSKVASKWNAQYLIEPTPGLSRARNAGALASPGDVIAYVDDDCVVDSKWLTALAVEFNKPFVVAVTGQVSPFPSKRALGYTDAFGTQPMRIDHSHPHWFEMAHFGGLGFGGNMAIRRSAFNSWHGFDERIGRGCEIDGGEENLALADLVDTGYAVCYTPAAVVFHSTRELDETDQTRYLQDLRNATAYVTLLLFERPRKARVAAYIVEALLGRKRSWRPHNGNEPSRPSFWRRLVAITSGPMLYFRSKGLEPAVAARSLQACPRGGAPVERGS